MAHMGSQNLVYGASGRPWTSFHVAWCIAFITHSTSHCSVICVGNAISTFIWDDIPPPKFNITGDQSTSDSVITNWSLVVVNCLLCCLRGSSGSITHMLSKNVPILTWRCSSRMTTTHLVISTVCSSVPEDVGWCPQYSSMIAQRVETVAQNSTFQ